MRHFLESRVLATAGFCYGLLLAGWGVVTATGGHGSYVIIGLSSSPLGLSDNIPLTILSAPILWCIVGAILGRVINRPLRKLFLGFMLAHYLALPFILSPASKVGVAHADRQPGIVAVGLVIYGAGQAILWTIFILRLRKQA